MSLPCHSECNEESAEGFLTHLEEVQRDFLKYTAQKIRFDLVDNNPEVTVRT